VSASLIAEKSGRMQAVLLRLPKRNEERAERVSIMGCQHFNRIYI
jgi:hypothetical protein